MPSRLDSGVLRPAGSGFDPPGFGRSQYPTIDIALIADPGNLDGTPSATLSGGLAFANAGLTDAADDVALATGTVISGSFGIQSNGQPGTHFVETFEPTSSQAAAFLDPIGPYVQIEEFLFNTATSRVAGTLSSGDTYVLVNGGFGTEDLQVPEPPSWFCQHSRQMPFWNKIILPRGASHAAKF